VRIPREAWKLDNGGEASHGYGTSVKVLVKARSSAIILDCGTMNIRDQT
jgi:hypothetical protein